MNADDREDPTARPCLIVADGDAIHVALVARAFRRRGWDVAEFAMRERRGAPRHRSGILARCTGRFPPLAHACGARVTIAILLVNGWKSAVAR